MRQFPIKGIIIGTLVSITLGFIAYVAVAVIGIYSNGLQSGGSSVQAIEIVQAYTNSKGVYLLSFPLTILLMSMAGYLGAKKSVSLPYLAIGSIAVLVCISMHFGFNVITIYKNYIPVILGCFIGGHVWVRKQKLNQALNRTP
ncbi:MAG: hypothetical protein ACMZ63_06450 [Methylotenera sp.]